MSYEGILTDTNRSDNRSVKVQAKVSGYSYGGVVTTKSSSVSLNRVVYDPAVLYVNYGWVQTCTIKGLLPDACEASVKLVR